MCAKAWEINREGYFTDGNGIRYKEPLSFIEPFRRLAHFKPLDDAVTFAQSFEGTDADIASWMVSHDAIYAALGKEEEVGIATESAIGKDYVAGLKDVPEGAEKGSFVGKESGLGEGEDGACEEGEEGDDTYYWETAAGFLVFGLWECFLVFGCIRHGGRGSVGDDDRSAVPEFFGVGCGL
jgi:hypothetical protein